LSWNAVANQPWISMNKASGIITDAESGVNQVEVLPDVQGLPAGTYTGRITVSGLGAYASPATIEVTLVLNEPPSLTVTAVAGANGSLDPSTPSPQKVEFGSTTIFTFNADADYYIGSVFGCGISYINTDTVVTTKTVTTGTITGACTVKAIFSPGEMYRLTVSITGNGIGRVTSDLAGIDCPGDCEEIYEKDDFVTLTAVPEKGSSFGGWTGDCPPAALICNVTMDQARSVEAKFTKFPWEIFLPAIRYNAKLRNSSQ